MKRIVINTIILLTWHIPKSVTFKRIIYSLFMQLNWIIFNMYTIPVSYFTLIENVEAAKLQIKSNKIAANINGSVVLVSITISSFNNKTLKVINYCLWCLDYMYCTRFCLVWCGWTHRYKMKWAPSTPLHSIHQPLQGQ